MPWLAPPFRLYIGFTIECCCLASMVDIAYGSGARRQKTYFLQHNIHYPYCTDLSIFANLYRVTIAFE